MAHPTSHPLHWMLDEARGRGPLLSRHLFLASSSSPLGNCRLTQGCFSVPPLLNLLGKAGPRQPSPFGRNWT